MKNEMGPSKEGVPDEKIWGEVVNIASLELNDDEVDEAVGAFRVLLANHSEAPLRKSLLDMGVDSMDLMQIIFSIEDAFGMEEGVLEDALDKSPEQMVAFIRGCLEKSGETE